VQRHSKCEKHKARHDPATPLLKNPCCAMWSTDTASQFVGHAGRPYRPRQRQTCSMVITPVMLNGHRHRQHGGYILYPRGTAAFGHCLQQGYNPACRGPNRNQIFLTSPRQPDERLLATARGKQSKNRRPAFIRDSHGVGTGAPIALFRACHAPSRPSFRGGNDPMKDLTGPADSFPRPIEPCQPR